MPMLTNMGSRLLGGGRLAQPVPALGAELLANGSMETGSPPTGWTTEAGSAMVTAAEERTGGAGSKSLQITHPTKAKIAIVPSSVGQWLYGTAWVRVVDTSSAKINFYDGIGTDGPFVAATTWTQAQVVCRVNNAASIQLYFQMVNAGSSRMDDASVKPITLASMFSTRAYTTHATTKARCTVVTGTRAGVVANLDSASTPANFVIASHNRTTARLTKCVAGTYTELISQAVAYVAGAFVEVRRLAGTDTWQLFYNSAQVGANQTISDAAIKNAALHGYFNTYAGNLLSEFSCAPSS